MRFVPGHPIPPSPPCLAGHHSKCVIIAIAPFSFAAAILPATILDGLMVVETLGDAFAARLADHRSLYLGQT